MTKGRAVALMLFDYLFNQAQNNFRKQREKTAKQENYFILFWFKNTQMYEINVKIRE